MPKLFFKIQGIAGELRNGDVDQIMGKDKLKDTQEGQTRFPGDRNISKTNYTSVSLEFFHTNPGWVKAKM